LKEAPAGPGRLLSVYDAEIAAGLLEADPAQRAVVIRLDRLNGKLAERRLAAKGSALGWMFAKRGARSEPVKGLYIFGEVGRGKSLLMDTFYSVAAPRRKRRAHFHEFMADVHDRIAMARETIRRGNGKGDAIVSVAAGIAEETRLLCLDEFFVSDIADAMILSRLFEQLFDRGLVLVATSNAAPEDLYPNGLNRGLFMPFIAVLRRHVEVAQLAARTDYRLEKLGRAPVYVIAGDAAAGRAALDATWFGLTGSRHGQPGVLASKGREIVVPEAAKGVARFAFDDLCRKPLGPGDYLKIARAFHTVMIDGIPVIREEERDVARRFISLIDTLYDNRVKLVASAAAEPDGLYVASRGDEALAFQRTASRLIEMRSDAWLALPHGEPGGSDTGAADAPTEAQKGR
jgi:cell division protein ZapE